MLEPVDDSSSTTERLGRQTLPLNKKFVVGLVLVGFVVQIGAMLLLRRNTSLNLIDGDEQVLRRETETPAKRG